MRGKKTKIDLVFRAEKEEEEEETLKPFITFSRSKI